MVVGGTHGIGSAITEDLVRGGAQVVVPGGDAGRAQAAEATLRAAGGLVVDDFTAWNAAS